MQEYPSHRSGDYMCHFLFCMRISCFSSFSNPQYLSFKHFSQIHYENLITKYLSSDKRIFKVQLLCVSNLYFPPVLLVVCKHHKNQPFKHRLILTAFILCDFQGLVQKCFLIEIVLLFWFLFYCPLLLDILYIKSEAVLET